MNPRQLIRHRTFELNKSLDDVFNYLHTPREGMGDPCHTDYRRKKLRRAIREAKR